MRLTKTGIMVALLALAMPLSGCSGGGSSSSSGSTSPPPPPPPPPAGSGFTVQSLGLLDGASSSIEHARDIAFDSAGAMYVVGGTSSPDFPTTANAYDRSFASGGSTLGNNGPLDAFITKFDPQGAIVWSTYLGGPNYERAYAVEVDSSGAVYVAGRAGRGFPTTAGSLQPSFAGDNSPSPAYGDQDGFIAKLSPDGGTLVWATYFGGSGLGFVRDIDIDAQGRIHLVAHINSNISHITGNADRSNRLGVNDVVYAVLSADGSSISYATYLGGTSTGNAFSMNPSVRVAPDGGAYVMYYDNASDVPDTSGSFQSSRGGGFDIILSRLTPSRAIAWTTYLGGNRDEDLETHSLSIDSSGNPVVVGRTYSKNFPTTANALQTSPGSSNTSDPDGFVSIISANGANLVASTYFGGSAHDELEGVTVLSDGTIVVSGTTRSNFLPTDSGSFQTFLGGGFDALVAQFSSDLSSLIYTTYIGGSANDAFRVIQAGPQDVLGVGGQTTSSNFPTVNSADISVNGQYAAVYGRLEPN